MPEQPHLLELDPIAARHQRDGLRAAALTDARRVALACTHVVHRIVGDGQPRELHVVAEQHHAGAARCSEGLRLEQRHAAVRGRAARLRQRVVAALDDHDLRGIATPIQRERRLVLDAERLAINARLDEHVGARRRGRAALPLCRQGIDRGLERAVRAAAIGGDDEGRRPARGIERLRPPITEVARGGGLSGRVVAELRPVLRPRGLQRRHAQPRHHRAAPASHHRSARYSAGSPSASALNSTCRSSGVNDGCGCVTCRLPL